MAERTLPLEDRERRDERTIVGCGEDAYGYDAILYDEGILDECRADALDACPELDELIYS